MNEGIRIYTSNELIFLFLHLRLKVQAEKTQ